MKVKIFKAADIDINFGLSLDAQVKGAAKVFERRLIQMWSAMILPHIVQEVLNLSQAEYTNELRSLGSKRSGMSTRTPSEESRVVMHKGFSGWYKNEDLKSDVLFYLAHGFSSAQIAELTCSTTPAVNSLIKRHDQVKLSGDTNLSTENKEARDASIVAEYTIRMEEFGINSMLSKKYNLSRRAIDLILFKAGVKKGKSIYIDLTTDRSKKILLVFNRINEGSVDESEHFKITKAAVELGVSSSRVRDVLIANGDIVPKKGLMATKRNEVHKDFYKLWLNKDSSTSKSAVLKTIGKKCSCSISQVSRMVTAVDMEILATYNSMITNQNNAISLNGMLNAVSEKHNLELDVLLFIIDSNK